MSAQQSKRGRKRAKELAFAKSQGGWNRAVAPRSRQCPTPAKRSWDSRESAEREARGKRAYRCRCKSWHLTTKEPA